MAVGEDGVYDKGAAFWPSKTGDGQVRLGQALRPVDPAVAAFLVAQTGGADSPYINLRPRTSAPQLETQTAPAPRYGRFTANGETFHLKLADCPAVACQNTSPIARFDLNERDQRTLQSYEAAANKEGAKDIFSFTIGAAGLSLPPTALAMIGGGAFVGGTENLFGQVVDTEGRWDQIDYGAVGLHTTGGAAFGAIAFGIVSKVPDVWGWVGSRFGNSAPDLAIGAGGTAGRPNLVNPSNGRYNCTACVSANITNKLMGNAPADLVTADMIELRFGSTGRQMQFSEAQSLAYIERATGTSAVKMPIGAPNAPTGNYAVYATTADGGHVLYGQVLPNGKYYFYDPQIGGRAMTLEQARGTYNLLRTYHMRPNP
ncbi:hypothetical protein [Rhizobacter sp. LjRoot28]|uniref:hypothetical protein n=1 Tax=Rhizobacter sp. LjRoot28 TaxID=3342309 RepID=UPI003ED016B8